MALALSVASAIVAALVLGWQVDISAPVEEDAAMLMRYAWHVADGQGFAWNPGEPPVDGATDFLSTALLAALYAAGISLEHGPRLLGGAAHALTVGLAVYTSVGVLRAPALAGLAVAAFLVLGPGAAYVEAGFLTTLFALGTLAGWTCILMAVQERPGRWPFLFAATMFLTSLARPEGIPLTLLLLGAAAILLDRPRARRFVTQTAILFACLGLPFLLWRVSYFGRLLPLPFLKKGGGSLHWDGLRESGRGLALMAGWTVPLFALGLRRDGPWRRLLAVSLVTAGFGTMWILLSSEMNFLWRFQYAVVPVLACSAWWVGDKTLDELRRAGRLLSRDGRLAVATAAALVLLLMFGRAQRTFAVAENGDGLRRTAALLAGHRTEAAVLVTTEAGLLPLYSGWRSIDAWGLNDARIVREQGITETYLAELNPTVIMMHDDRSEDLPGWSRMVDTLERFAVCRGYERAAVFSEGGASAHVYYVHPGWANAAAFGDALRRAPYHLWTPRVAASEIRARYPQPAC